jgi:hypothetical protein
MPASLCACFLATFQSHERTSAEGSSKKKKKNLHETLCLVFSSFDLILINCLKLGSSLVNDAIMSREQRHKERLDSSQRAAEKSMLNRRFSNLHENLSRDSINYTFHARHNL